MKYSSERCYGYGGGSRGRTGKDGDVKRYTQIRILF